jgi:hypothetical protein
VSHAKHMARPVPSHGQRHNGPLCTGGEGFRGFSRPMWECLLLNTMSWSGLTSHRSSFFRWVQFNVMNIMSLFNLWFSPVILQHHHLIVRLKTLVDSSRDSITSCKSSFVNSLNLIPLINGESRVEIYTYNQTFASYVVKKTFAS